MEQNPTPLEPGASITLPPEPAPAPSESAPEPEPAAEPTPEPTTDDLAEFTTWLRGQPKEVQDEFKQAGPNLAKHFAKRYDELGKERAALRAQPKPAEPERIEGTRQAMELKALKAVLEKRLQKEPSRFEEFEELYKEASDIAGQYDERKEPLTLEKLDEILQERFEREAMNRAALELVSKTKGRIPPDDAFAFVNGLTAKGLGTEEAVQRVVEYLGNAEKSAAAEAVKEIVQPKTKTPIVAPGTQPVAPPKKEAVTDDDIAKEALEAALKDAARGL
jgi:hypothetical protein